MTAILSQMDDRHYATYIETFSGTSDLVVSTHTYRQMSVKYALMVRYKKCLSVLNEDIITVYTHSSSLVHFTAGLPHGVLPTFQGPDWETCVSL